MKTRKIVLLSLIAILLAVYIIQLVEQGKSSTKIYALEGNPDTILINKADGSELKITRNGEMWMINGATPADPTKVQGLINEVKEIRILDVVSRDALDEQYGLDAENCLNVQFLESGKTLRKMRIGKRTSTTYQTYVQLDDSKDVLLLSGSPVSVFDTTEEDLKLVVEEPVPEATVETDPELDIQ